VQPASAATTDIVELGIDHPGAHDPLYRRRRDEIAALARAHQGSDPPILTYTGDEHATWRVVCARLRDLHQRHGSVRYLDGKRQLGIADDRIPQLADLSQQLERLHGFRIRAIEGLIDSRRFLCALGERVMSSTQYLRHPSRPAYTPEPDVVHEVIGHLPLFVDPDFAAMSIRLGRAAARATDGQMALLDRLYWYTLEFGMIEERGEPRAYGAGLLSSFGELTHAYSAAVERAPFDVERAISTPYHFSAMQDLLFVIPSFRALDAAVGGLLESARYRSA
jgi:phenylalanine-4-hydroxylase